MARGPGRVPRFFRIYKLGLLFSDVEVPDSQSPDWVRLVAAPGLGLAFLSFGWLTPWAAVGLARGERSPFWWFLVATTAAGLISTAAFFVLGRYRVPWAPCVALLAAAGVVDLARRIKARRWGQVAVELIAPGHARGFLGLAPGRAILIQSDGDTLRSRSSWRTFRLTTWTRQSMRLTTPGRPTRTPLPRRPSPGEDWVHDQWKAAVGRAWASASNAPEKSILRFARLARVVPETHGLAGQMLDEAERTLPDSPALWRERGGWWLGRQHDDATAHSAQSRPTAVPRAIPRLGSGSPC